MIRQTPPEKVHLAAMADLKHWQQQVRDRKNTLNQFAIGYDGQLNARPQQEHLKRQASYANKTPGG